MCSGHTHSFCTLWCYSALFTRGTKRAQPPTHANRHTQPTPDTDSGDEAVIVLNGLHLVIGDEGLLGAEAHHVDVVDSPSSKDLGTDDQGAPLPPISGQVIHPVARSEAHFDEELPTGHQAVTPAAILGDDLVNDSFICPSRLWAAVRPHLLITVEDQEDVRHVQVLMS